MPETYTTVRTVTSIVTKTEPVAEKPEFGVKDYVQVYCGQYEGHCFWIKEVRWNHDIQKFEYLYGGMLMGGWYTGGCLVLLKRAEAEKEQVT